MNTRGRNKISKQTFNCVINLIRSGAKQKDICAAMHISPHTVRNIVAAGTHENYLQMNTSHKKKSSNQTSDTLPGQMSIEEFENPQAAQEGRDVRIARLLAVVAGDLIQLANVLDRGTVSNFTEFINLPIDQ